jgi:hypothetical protein
MSDSGSAPERPQSPLRNPLAFMVVAVVAMSVLAYLFVEFSTAERANPFVERQPFAGCYFAKRADPIELRLDGRVMVGSSVVGTYDIRAPVGGKHGHLLELSGTGFALVQGRPTLSSESQLQRLDIEPSGVISVYAGESEVRFHKRACGEAKQS